MEEMKIHAPNEWFKKNAEKKKSEKKYNMENK